MLITLEQVKEAYESYKEAHERYASKSDEWDEAYTSELEAAKASQDGTIRPRYIARAKCEHLYSEMSSIGKERSKAEALHRAAKYVYTKQLEYDIAASLASHVELDGKPTRYKRTKNAMAKIVKDATGLDVYINDDGEICIEDASVDVGSGSIFEGKVFSADEAKKGADYRKKYIHTTFEDCREYAETHAERMKNLKQLADAYMAAKRAMQEKPKFFGFYDACERNSYVW